MKLSDLFSGITPTTPASARVVGIDIGSSSIKVVEVEDRGGVVTLTTYGELQLGPYANDAVGQSVTLDQKQEQQALVDVMRESAVKSKNAVFAMPLASSFVTTIGFSAAPEEDLSSRVRVEARKYIPVPIGEVTLDWAEIISDTRQGAAQRDVLLAAIQNDALTRFKILMTFAGLKEPPTEIECFSALRGVYKEGSGDIAVIDVGAISTKLYIARNGLLQRMHRVRAGGSIATKRIASALDLSFDEAEVLKRGIAKEDANYADVKRAHHSVYERVFQEFRQVIREYEQSLGTTVNVVYLTGGGSLFNGFNQSVSESLSKPVEYVNAFNKVAYPAFMEDMMTGLAPSFHVALGSALRLFE